MSEFQFFEPENPAVIKFVRLVQYPDRKVIHAVAAEDGMTTITWYNRAALAKDGGWDRDETSKWEYGPEPLGNVYELPKELTVHWESVTSQTSGREYKKVLGVITGLEPNGNAPSIETPNLPTTASEVQDQLEGLAPLLAEAKANKEAAEQAKKDGVASAIAAYQSTHQDVYDAETQAVKRYNDLTAKAYKLLDKVAETGAKGRVVQGYYQINRPDDKRELRLVTGLEMNDLVNTIIHEMPFLRHYLTVDLSALDAKLGGEVPNIMFRLPVEYVDVPVDPKGIINWTKLPEPALQDAPQSAQSLLELRQMNAGSEAE